MVNIVTPWEVKGNIDYDNLIENFGVEKIDESLLKRIEEICKKKGKDVHYFLKRNIFFAHRDLKFILDEYDKGNKFFLYTGRAPSGNVHIGHLVTWIFTKWLQDVFDVELWFQFPDEEKFLFKKNLSLEDTNKFLNENILDVVAIGFNPDKTHFIVDTKHAGLMYKEAIKVAKYINFSTLRSVFGFTNEQNIGTIFYTAMQTVPTFLPSILANKKIPCLISHAIDQDPHFRLSRDVLKKIGQYKPASIQCRFLPGLRGIENDGKMSSSGDQNSAIYTTDSEKSIKKKINKYAFSGGRDTIEEHRKYGGNPDIDISYQWLVFFEEDDKKLKEIYDNYKSGKLLSGEIKQILIKKISEFLAEHQARRNNSKELLSKFFSWEKSRKYKN